MPPLYEDWHTTVELSLRHSIEGCIESRRLSGRYDKSLEMFGGDPMPAAGFGFGDAVIVELLKERNKLPSFGGCGFDSVVFDMNVHLYGATVEVASRLHFARKWSQCRPYSRE
eukprot:CCRYP_016764-RA/>CCRYP_016764-RA protein AED:0.29 eAED:0.29 QI:0/-1/0/1/-1/1/1/0/112